MSQLWQAEERCIECRLPIPRIHMHLQGTWRKRWSVLQIVVHSVAESAQQRRIGIVVHRHGKTGTETRRAGNGPALGQSVGMEEQIEGKSIGVARNKVVLHVERR